MISNEKFKALVHYICHKCEDSSRLGATKLNKVLWFADTIWYKQHGESITGANYKKLQFGPVPVEIQNVLHHLEGQGQILIRNSDHFGKTKRDFVSLSEPNTQVLNEEELKFIEEIIDFVCDGHTATSISDLTHDVVWEAAGMGEEIPMYAVLSGNFAPLTEEDMNWADEVLRKVAA